MSESTVHLQGNVEVLIPEADVGAQRHLRCGLSCNVTVAMITEIDYAVIIQVSNVIFVVSVPVVNDSLAVRKIEHTQRLADNLVQYIAVSAMKTGTVHTTDSRNVRCRHLSPVTSAVQREQSVLLPCHVDIDVELHVFL